MCCRMRRERNLRYRKMLEDQIREREEREILEPAVMTVQVRPGTVGPRSAAPAYALGSHPITCFLPGMQEAKLNEPILVSATRILGPDHIKKDTLTSRPDVRYTTLGRFAP